MQAGKKATAAAGMMSNDPVLNKNHLQVVRYNFFVSPLQGLL